MELHELKKAFHRWKRKLLHCPREVCHIKRLKEKSTLSAMDGGRKAPEQIFKAGRTRRNCRGGR